jgi:hypothetical protein
MHVGGNVHPLHLSPTQPMCASFIPLAMCPHTCCGLFVTVQKNQEQGRWSTVTVGENSLSNKANNLTLPLCEECVLH